MKQSGTSKSFQCPGCGASAPQEGVPCIYCGTLTVKASIHGEPSHKYDFGFKNPRILWSVILIANLLSLIASFLNGRSFFDSTTVMAIWFAVIPILLITTGTAQRAQTPSIIPLFSIIITIGFFSFLITVVKMNWTSGYWGYIDDSLALGAVTGSVAGVSYLAGRLLHRYFEYLKEQNRI